MCAIESASWARCGAAAVSIVVEEIVKIGGCGTLKNVIVTKQDGYPVIVVGRALLVVAPFICNLYAAHATQRTQRVPRAIATACRLVD